jgi:hypothetical protein
MLLEDWKQDLRDLGSLGVWVLSTGPWDWWRAIRREGEDFMSALQSMGEIFGGSTGSEYKLTDLGIRREFSDGQVEEVRWDQLRAVAIHTTSDGPWGEDFFWVLMGEGGSGCVVGNEVACELKILDRLQELDGFDNQAVILASASVEEAWFPCWERNGESP